MRWRQVIWLVGCVLFLAAVWGWLGRLGRSKQPPARLLVQAQRPPAPGSLPAPGSALKLPVGTPERLAFRLQNSSQSLQELLGCDHAILLENALIDTSRPLHLPIPAAFRAGADPGAYLVQLRTGLTEAVRSRLQQSGARLVSYIPNRTWLVRGSAAAARAWAADPQVQAVVAFEPYFKLKGQLLAQAIEQNQASQPLTLLLFPADQGAAREHFHRLGLEIVREEASPFGPLVRVQDPQLPPTQFSSLLASLAALAEVQAIERATPRQQANDLCRTNLGVAASAATPANYWGLTGTNVLLGLIDSGVDTNHPDLAERVVCATPGAGEDVSGHGTHVAGIIAGSGLRSTSVTGAAGSPMPAVAGQFRGLAPAARLLSLLSSGSDAALQQTVARSNVFLSNNSWNYGAAEYDLAAASYDAAVRDSLPTATGSQPVLYVFSAGNRGRGEDDGTGGDAGSILSPATAKNVITVGACEEARQIACEVVSCVTNGGLYCTTNQPWLGLTDSRNQVARFSSRGNVGVGVEGQRGRFKPDVVAPGTFVVSARSTGWGETAYYGATNAVLGFTNFGCASLVLSNLNRSLGGACAYRYETGTSLAAAEVTGLLALMQECFQRLGRTSSPALMKALLINGARPLAAAGFDATTNAQGWGRVQLPTTLPASLTNSQGGATALQTFDQDPARALATGQSHTRYVQLSPTARLQDLRVTLVWTDPPGNPLAALKLVNNLDLVVTNLDTGQVFFGNDFLPGAAYAQAWDAATAAPVDVVNNVERVCLHPTESAPLGVNYSVTVRGGAVNVNAVTAASNVVQDYALVLASGEGDPANRFTVVSAPSEPERISLSATNLPAAEAGDVGLMLLDQRVGAHGPLPDTNTVWLGPGLGQVTIGQTNQWRFYAVTNNTGFTNAAFVLFQPASLAVAPFTLTDETAMLPARPDPDLDLYVSMDPGLTDLDPSALANAAKSLGRGGWEAVLLDSAVPGVYYVGVKSESQQAAEFNLAAVFGEQPFSTVDAQGNQLLRGFQVAQAIPDGAAAGPGNGYVLAVGPGPLPLHRIVVTNTLAHARLADLTGTLTHQGLSTVLHREAGSPAPEHTFVFDDAEEQDISGTQPTAGPGSLRDFARQFEPQAAPWLLTESDSVPGVSGTNLALGLFLEYQPDLVSGLNVVVNPGSAREDYLDVPLAATNLTVTVALNSGGPLAAYVGRAGAAESFCQSLLVSNLESGSMAVDNTTHPPLCAGRYMVRLVNLGPDLVAATVRAAFALDTTDPLPASFTATTPVPILDDAVSVSSVFVTNLGPVLSLEVGVRLEHPRVSDLALALVSPGGQRVALMENRGGAAPGGLGLNTVFTNTTPISSSGGPAAATNVVDTGQIAGSLTIDYQFYAKTDSFCVYYQGAQIFSESVNGVGTWVIPYSGTSSIVTIVVNEGNNDDPDTAWDYVLTCTRSGYIYTTFTENTNLAPLPIKLATPPFNVPNAPAGIFYLPEQSLREFAGEDAFGRWTLELWDTRAGASNPPPGLVSWQLNVFAANPVPKPIVLTHGAPRTVTLPPGEIQCFWVRVPGWVQAVTNLLRRASAPVNVLFSQTRPPTGTSPPGEVTLLANTDSASIRLSTNSAPVLVPGLGYYLGVQNLQTGSITFEFEIDLQVTPLAAGQALACSVPPKAWPRYFCYDVSTNADAVAFTLSGLTADAQLAVRRELPFPTLDNADYVSSNAAAATESLLIQANSAPVPLAPGRWYLGVFNADLVEAAGALLATEIHLATNNIFLLDSQVVTNSFCLTWSSLVGAKYFVEGKTNPASPDWTALSPGLEAVDSQTTWCLPYPPGFGWLQLREEPAVITNTPPSFSGISLGPEGVRLEWSGPAGAQFQVQWTDALPAAWWNTFPDLITSGGGPLFFLDDGSQSGGLTAPRFYRLVQVP